MSTPDIIILICFLPAIISGIMKGFIEQAVALVSLILGAWLAFKFSTVVSGWLQPYFEVSETVLNVISFVVIMVAVVLVLFVLGKILTGVSKLVMLGWLDRLLGLVFALLKAGLIIGILIILFDTLNVKFEFVEEKVLDEWREAIKKPMSDMKELLDKAAASGDAMDAQKANDLAAQCDRFEKKLYDLKLTRQVAIQMAPQIRLLQNNDSLLVERIQSTLSNTLPLWKSQMVLALGMHHSQEALKAQTAVTDMTNELLKQNAQALKVGTIQTAKEAERGIIDIETLIQTNQDLIDTINEVMEIQSQGHAKRIEAEKTLYSMEAELKKKLLSTRI